jgi:hypothetical protein
MISQERLENQHITVHGDFDFIPISREFCGEVDNQVENWGHQLALPRMYGEFTGLTILKGDLKSFTRNALAFRKDVPLKLNYSCLKRLESILN